MEALEIATLTEKLRMASLAEGNKEMKQRPNSLTVINSSLCCRGTKANELNERKLLQEDDMVVSLLYKHSEAS
jgi:hypothetical protein